MIVQRLRSIRPAAFLIPFYPVSGQQPSAVEVMAAGEDSLHKFEGKFKNDQDQYITFSENDSGKIKKLYTSGVHLNESRGIMFCSRMVEPF